MTARKPSSAALGAIDLDGKMIPARPGQSIAAALLESGVRIFSRSVKYHRPRGPFCFAGRCSHCLMRVNGVPNVTTCRVTAESPCRVSVQNVMGSARLDVLGSIDFLFPRGLDHHEMFAGVPVVEKAVAVVARHLAGLGKLPEGAAPPIAAAESLHPDVVVVGAGPAGVAFAEAAAKPGRRVLLVDEQPEAGGLAGSLRTGDEEAAFERSLVRLRHAGCEIRPATSVVGHYQDDRGPFLAAVTSSAPLRVLKIYFRALGLCTGGQEPLWVFPGNDLPGVYAGRGLARFCKRERLACGNRVVLLARHADATPVARALEASGAGVAAVIVLGGDKAIPDAEAGGYELVRAESIVTAKGTRGIEKIVISAMGKKRTLLCDAVVLCGPASPAFELASQADCALESHGASGGFAVRVDASGATTRPGIFAAGHVVGADSGGEAAEQGRRAGNAAAAFTTQR